MRAVTFSRSFVAKINGAEQHFTGTSEELVNAHEIYVGMSHDMGVLIESAISKGITCRDVTLSRDDDPELPINLGGSFDRYIWLPRNQPVIDELVGKIKPDEPLRIALVNGLGSGLGDNLGGLRAMQLLASLLPGVRSWFEIDVHRLWGNRNSDHILKDEPWVNKVYGGPCTLHHWRTYHGYIDLTAFTDLPGFLQLPWPDFHMVTLGIDPSLVPAEMKRASLPIRNLGDFQRGVDTVLRLAKGRKSVFVHATTTTPLRTIPQGALRRLLHGLNDMGYCIMTADHEVEKCALANVIPVMRLRDVTLDELRGMITAVDIVTTADTFVMHAANLTNTPVLALVVAHQQYPDNKLTAWQESQTVFEVDYEQRFAGRFGMGIEEMQEKGNIDYFNAAWEEAVDGLLLHVFEMRTEE